MRRVVVAGGDGGGHVVTGLAVVRELQAMGVSVHWLGVAGGLEAELVGPRQVPLELLDLGPRSARGSGAETDIVRRFPRAVVGALRALLDVRPQAVLGVGGVASAAGLIAAGILGIPWVLHEQNSLPDAVNRFLAPWADLVCCGFADAVARFPSLPAEWTGNPVRREFFDLPRVQAHDPPHVLVLAGRQGALFLNRSLPRAMVELRRAGISALVHHHAGVRWAEVVRTSYQDLDIEAKVHSDMSEPLRELAHADLVVARSAAITVSQLAAAGRGAVLIPLGDDGRHQERNARAVERAGGAVVLEEWTATPQRIAAALGELLRDGERLVTMGRSMRAMAHPDAARCIADRLLAMRSVG